MHARRQIGQIVNRWPARGAALATGLLATVALSGCQPLSDALVNKDVTYCTIMPDAPVVTHDQIIGPSHFRCDGGGADSITMTVDLQRQDTHGQWRTVVTATTVTHGKDTTRDTSEASRVRSVSTRCAAGTFRTLIHAVENSRGHTDTVDAHSVTVPDPCNLSAPLSIP